MTTVSAEYVRSLVLEKLQSSLTAKGLRVDDIPDNYDLLTEGCGVIDSMGIPAVDHRGREPVGNHRGL